MKTRLKQRLTMAVILGAFTLLTWGLTAGYRHYYLTELTHLEYRYLRLELDGLSTTATGYGLSDQALRAAVMKATQDLRVTRAELAEIRQVEERLRLELYMKRQAQAAQSLRRWAMKLPPFEPVNP